MDNFNIEDFLMHCDEYQIAEESKKGTERNVFNSLCLLYGHMLKYQYKPNNQSGSWVGSIFNSYIYISNISTSQFNTVKDNIEIMDKAYAHSIETVACKNTGYKPSDFPKDRPFNWTIENVSDFNFIVTFLYENAKDSDMKDHISNKINRRF